MEELPLLPADLAPAELDSVVFDEVAVELDEFFAVLELTVVELDALELELWFAELKVAESEDPCAEEVETFAELD
jgi:hypothetical protein